MYFRDNEINRKKTKGMFHFHFIVAINMLLGGFIRHVLTPHPPVGSAPSMPPIVRMQEEWQLALLFVNALKHFTCIPVNASLSLINLDCGAMFFHIESIIAVDMQGCHVIQCCGAC